MNNKNTSLEKLLIINCSTTQMDEKACNSSIDIIKKDINWDYILNTAKAHNVAPLMYPNLKILNENYAIPQDILLQFRKRYHITGIKNSKMYNELAVLLKDFKENEIEVMLIKGAALAILVYKNISLRPMSDVDILIKKEDAEKVKNILIENNYREDIPYQRKYFLEISPSFPSFVKDNFSIDVKWKIRYFSKVKYDFFSFSQRAITIEINKSSSLSLSIEDQLILIYYHLLKHTSQNEAQLLWYCDSAEILRRYSDEIDWNYIFNNLLLSNNSISIYNYLQNFAKYFGITSLPEKISENKHPQSDFNFQNILNNSKRRNTITYRLSTVINKINMIDNTGDKFLYILGCLFPGKSFLVKRYNIKNALLVPVYFLLRPFFLLLEVVVSLLIRTKKYFQIIKYKILLIFKSMLII